MQPKDLIHIVQAQVEVLGVDGCMAVLLPGDKLRYIPEEDAAVVIGSLRPEVMQVKFKLQPTKLTKENWI